MPVLRLSARTLQSSLRHYDILARYGADTFVVVLPDTPLLGGQSAAERALRAARENTASFAVNGDSMSLAIGLAAYPTHGAEPSALLTAVDRALDRAKHNGSGLALADTHGQRTD